MKTYINIITSVLLVFVITAFTSCSKDAGLDPGADISGTVTYPGGQAEGALVYITYGTTEATTDYNDVTVTDQAGTFSFEGLEKGDYYLDAKYTDEFGNTFNTPGYAITIGEKKAELTVDIALN